VCLTVPRCIPTLLHAPGCTWGNDRRCPLVVHYWADLQSVHGFHCCDNIAPNASGPSCNEPQFSSTRNVSECLYSVYARSYLATMSTKTGTRVPSPGPRTTTNQWPYSTVQSMPPPLCVSAHPCRDFHGFDCNATSKTFYLRRVNGTMC